MNTTFQQQESEIRSVEAPDNSINSNNSNNSGNSDDSINSDNSNKKNRKSRFYKGLLIYFVIMIGVVLIGSGIWWECVQAYEQSQPENKAEQVVAGFDSYLCEMLKQVCTENALNRYESFDSVYSEMIKPSFFGEFSFKKYAKEFTSQNPVYIILCGEKNVAKLTLEKGDVKAFGLQEWSVKSTELIADVSMPEAISVTVKVPSDAVLYINGVRVEADDPIAREQYKYVSKYEKNATGLPEMLVYRFDGFYRNPDVKAFDQSGEMLKTSKEDGEYVCHASEKIKHTVSITVPPTAIVTLGGVVLGSETIVDSQIKYDKAAPYDNAYLVKYEIDGLFTYPEITVALESGEWLVPESEKDGEYIFGYAKSMLHDVIVAIPNGSTVLICGKAPEEGMLELVKEKAVYPDMKKLGGYVTGMVMPDLYTVSDLYGEPEIAVFDSEGKELQLVKGGDGDEADIYFLPPFDDKLKEEHSDLVEEYVDAYIRYTSGGYKVVEKTFEEAAAYLIPNSPAYEKLLSTKFSFGQNKEFIIRSREIKSYDYRWLGENCFSCKVDFTAHIYTTYTSTVQNVTDTVTDMKLWYAYSGGEWKIVGLAF